MTDIKSVAVLVIAAGAVFYVLTKKMPIAAMPPAAKRSPEEIMLANMLKDTAYI